MRKIVISFIIFSFLTICLHAESSGGHAMDKSSYLKSKSSGFHDSFGSIIEASINKKCHFFQKGRRGPPGPTGANGATGATGANGANGATGPTGPAGMDASCITYGQPNVLWVDKNTSIAPADQNGTLCKPFSTIQAAINAIPPNPNDLTAMLRGWTVMIADGFYDEDVTVQGDNQHIFLVGLANAGIGSITGSLRTLTWNLTSANNVGSKEIPAALSLINLNAPQTGFIVNGTVVINNTGGQTSFGAFIGGLFDPFDTGSFAINGTGVIELFLSYTTMKGPITDNTGLAELQQAIHCEFGGLVTVKDYGSIQSSSFATGLTLTTAATGTRTEPEGLINTFFSNGSNFISNPSVQIALDTYTNYWIKNNCATQPLASQKLIIFDAVP